MISGNMYYHRYIWIVIFALNILLWLLYLSMQNLKDFKRPKTERFDFIQTSLIQEKVFVKVIPEIELEVSTKNDSLGRNKSIEMKEILLTSPRVVLWVYELANNLAEGNI